MTQSGATAYSGQFESLGTTTLAQDENGQSDYQRWTYTAADGASVQIAVLASDLVRVRYVPAGRSAARSWSVVRDSWPALAVRTDQGENGTLRVTTDAMRVEIAPDPFRLAFSWPDGAPFAEDDPARGMGIVSAPTPERVPDTNLPPGMVRCYKRLAPAEQIIGAAERASRLSLRGSTMTFWNVDPPLHHLEHAGPMYASIPFWMGLRGGRVYGIFLDTAGKADLDAGSALPDTLSFGAAGGDLTYYVFAGPTPQAVLARYADLTGHMSMPPKWALGYGQSRWSYFPDTYLRAVATELRHRQIPADSLWLDIDYMDGYRVFTWNSRRFPHPARVLRELAAQGFRVVAIIDPGVRADPMYSVFTEGLEKDYFVRHPDGTVCIGVVWPGECAFPDFSRAEVREWWGQQQATLLDAGIAGIWDDMNEPAMSGLFAPGAGVVHGDTLPLDVLHLPDGPDGEPLSHAAFHNAYGMQMARATYEGLARYRPERRPFVLTRSGFAGIQRYAAIWTGDNDSSWDYIRLAARMCLTFGLCGVPFAGFDAGGFWGDADGELLVRFTQLGAVMPFFRNHSAMYTKAQEPWAFGQPWEAFCQQAIELRYQLLPYLYTEVAAAARTGAPIARPLIYEHPDEADFIDIDDEFLIGNSLLAAPVMTQNTTRRAVVFPKGIWIDWYSGRRYQGSQRQDVEAPVDVLPLFAREGSIIPIAPVMQYVGERPEDPLTLACYLSSDATPKARGVLYEDDGETPAWRSGKWRLTHFAAELSSDGLTFSANQPEGAYSGDVREWLLEFHLPHAGGARPTLGGARVNDQLLDDDWEMDERRYETVVRIPVGRIAAPFTITLTFAARH